MRMAVPAGRSPVRTPALNGKVSAICSKLGGNPGGGHDGFEPVIAGDELLRHFQTCFQIFFLIT
jgi:hypothetical protein